jgi:hypothetical protein
MKFPLEKLFSAPNIKKDNNSMLRKYTKLLYVIYKVILLNRNCLEHILYNSRIIL